MTDQAHTPETPALWPSPPPRSLSSFVGRRGEIESLKGILCETRLLTLTGPGGCGKSRLAIEVAAEIASRFKNGVAFADLAPVQDSVMVREAIASSLGPFRQASLDAMTGIVGTASLLLVVDNAEHLVEAVSSLVDGLLARCPNLRIMVTSREPLNIGGEMSWPVPPLELPPDDAHSDPLRLATCDAVELFSVRAVEHQAAFELTAESAGIVVAICRRLDGLPLALELAAARVRSMGLAEIRRRLADSLLFLAGGPRTAMARHRTLHATVDWSHRLLDHRERMLFRRMAVFVNTFDVEAVEGVCTGSDLPPGEVAETLHQLIDKSLVMPKPRPDGSLRYGLIEVIRQYGQERLDVAGESWVRARHAAYYAALVRRLAVGGWDALKGRPGRMSAEYDNVRVALDWSAKNDPAMEAEMVDGLRWYWLLRGSVREARTRIHSALANEPSSLAVRASLLADAANWAQWAGDLGTAVMHIDEASRLLDQIADTRLASRILQHRAIVHCRNGDLVAAEKDLRRAIEMLSPQPSSASLVIALNNLAFIHLLAGRPDRALEQVKRTLAVRARVSGPRTVLASLFTVHAHGAALLGLDRAAEARSQFLRGLEIVVEHNNHAAGPGFLNGLGCVAAAMGNPTRCLEFLAAAERCIEMVGGLEAMSAMPVAVAERRSRVVLGVRTAEEAWTRGLGMGLREALELAQTDELALTDLPLTPRKKEIVRLVAAGLTDKEIARQLTISVRTVHSHLEQIRHEFGFHNRAQLAAWAASKGLASGLPAYPSQAATLGGEPT
jgi:predicted ATPase/DNA-binding CsgD family transcriptional regulator